MHDFRKLRVYQRALNLTRHVRCSTLGFPADELYGLTSQFRRASYSIVLNIAEGAGNQSEKEFARFLQIAMRSGYECLGCLDIARVNELMPETEMISLEAETKEIISMLVGLKRSLVK